MYHKKILTHLQSHNPIHYILSDYFKKLLDFPQACMGQSQFTHQPELVALDCEMVETDKGEQIVKVTIVDEKQQHVFNEILKPVGNVLDYRSKVTGFNQTSFKNVQFCWADLKQKVKGYLQDKILVGHDIANDLKAMELDHQNIIDTLLIFQEKPLPIKVKLKDIALKYLRLPIQIGSHDSTEDAIATLRLAQYHIREGRGIIQCVQSEQRLFTDPDEIFQQCGLDKNKIRGFYLRGSRVFGNVTQDSDYDYICAYETTATIADCLMTLYKVDIAFYDHRSFQRYLDQCEISFIEVLYFEKQFRIIDQFKIPQLNYVNLRQSLTDNVYRTKYRAKVFARQQQYFKAIKKLHVTFRYYYMYEQLVQHHAIVNFRATMPLWLQMQKAYESAIDKKEIYEIYLQKLDKFGSEFRIKYPPIRKRADKIIQKQQKKYKGLNSQQIKYDIKYQKKEDGYLNVIHFLKDGHSLEKLEQIYFVMSVRHERFQNLILLRYVLGCDFKHAITRQCRGIIVDQDDNYSVVACPYFKFFDYNHQYSQQIQWEGCKVYEKYDGSTAVLYFYKHQWHVSSSSRPDGSGAYCFHEKQSTIKFRDQFWRIFKLKQYKLPAHEDEQKTFIFELLSKDHQNIVNIINDELILHGVRTNSTLQEDILEPYRAKYGWSIAQQVVHNCKNLEDLILMADKFDPRQRQGFVIVENNYRRIKVKSSNYVRAAWVKPNNKNVINEKFMLEIILKNEHESFIKYCPEWTASINKVLAKLKKVQELIFNFNHDNKHLEMKYYAQQLKAVLNPLLHPICFKLRRQQLNSENWMHWIQFKKVLQIVRSLQI